MDAVREADASGTPLLLLAGGSNVVIADEGFDGLVLRIATRGIERRDQDGAVRLSVAAGESWDALVAGAVADGLVGVECLAGIPGSVGATPIQNVGAYGQEVSETIASVRVLDRRSGEVEELAPAQCGFGYRTSAFKRAPGERVVLAVELVLARADESAPVRYGELARALGIDLGASAPAAAVREAVLGLRRGKGMVVDPADPDSVSAGSFFTNPILERRARSRRSSAGPASARPRSQSPTGASRPRPRGWSSARAFGRGYGDGRAGISSKHTLALVNRGGATTAELVALAREIAAGVQRRFGVELVPEPVFVGHRW